MPAAACPSPPSPCRCASRWSALAAIDRLSTVGDFSPASDTRTFRITMPDLAGVLIAPPLLARMSTEAPGIGLQILGSERDALKSLIDDSIDLVVGAPQITHPALYTRRITRAALGWSVLRGPGHPAWGGEMSREQWLASTHVQITPNGQPDAPSFLDEMLQEAGLTRAVRVHIGYLAALGPLLSQTAHVTTLPTPVARQLAASHGLQVSAHPLDALPQINLRMVWHQTQHADPGHSWLRRIIAETLEALGL